MFDSNTVISDVEAFLSSQATKLGPSFGKKQSLPSIKIARSDVQEYKVDTIENMKMSPTNNDDIQTCINIDTDQKPESKSTSALVVNKVQTINSQQLTTTAEVPAKTLGNQSEPPHQNMVQEDQLLSKFPVTSLELEDLIGDCIQSVQMSEGPNLDEIFAPKEKVSMANLQATQGFTVSAAISCDTERSQGIETADDPKIKKIDLQNSALKSDKVTDLTQESKKGKSVTNLEENSGKKSTSQQAIRKEKQTEHPKCESPSAEVATGQAKQG